MGLTDSKEEGKFKLLSGDVLGDYKNWKKGRPQSGSNSADCVSMSSADKWKWVDGSCYDRKDAYCKIDFFQHNYKRYHISSMILSWKKAEDYCMAMGGHLTSVKNGDENKFLVSLVRENS